MSESQNRTVTMELDHVEQYFPQGSGLFHALQDVNLQIYTEDFICLLGASGCGKTTLLNILAGYAKPYSGTVRVDGQEFSKPSPDVGVVFQQANLFPWLSVRDNIEFGLKRKGKLSRAERREITDYYMDVVGLTKFADSLPYQLSGGMKQRATIARTLAPDPKIILLDEPFSALDALTREKLQQHIYQIWQKTREKKSFVFITHDVDEALLLSNRILVMQPGPGRVANDFTNGLDRSSPSFFRTIRETDEFWNMRNYLIDQITTKESPKDTEPPKNELLVNAHQRLHGRGQGQSPAPGRKEVYMKLEQGLVQAVPIRDRDTSFEVAYLERMKYWLSHPDREVLQVLKETIERLSGEQDSKRLHYE